MRQSSCGVQLLVHHDGFFPRAFRWRGQLIRVLAVEGVQTHGIELRYRVLTRVGHFEIGLFTDTGWWHMRRQPTWIVRLRSRWRHGTPRYPLPVWRRRRYGGQPAPRRPDMPASYGRRSRDRGEQGGGGNYADGFAVV